MRHVDLAPLLTQIFADVDGEKAKKSLAKAHVKIAKKRSPKTRKQYVENNGSGKWKLIKDRLTAQLGTKCWYTEVELIGAPLAIDHYRPVILYWWLAFDPENYRVACPWANSPKHNVQYGSAGGKGDKFPLLPPDQRATTKDQLQNELPIILDPCRSEDCGLLAFQADGRPILNPVFAGDAVARRRVEESKIILNLDHADFNTKREQLCILIGDYVRTYEALSEDSTERTVIRTRLAATLESKSSFSTAARFFLQFYRHFEWVESILTPKCPAPSNANP